tara:strand:- start:1765 stop:1905 length:141 start_codon:yes stop_codon:yes gene_type:complete
MDVLVLKFIQELDFTYNMALNILKTENTLIKSKLNELLIEAGKTPI